jgi:cytochrome P450
MASLHQYLFYAARMGVYSEWHKSLFGLYQRYFSRVSGIAHVAVFAMQRINKRLRNPVDEGDKPNRDPADFLTKLLSIREQDPSKISKDDIFAVCFANVGAGSDTTSISLNAALYYLYKNPPVLQRLRAEIESKRADGELSEPITFQQGQSMPYLQAVIREALRMHPAAAYPLMRVVPQGGATVAGHKFSPGVCPLVP